MNDGATVRRALGPALVCVVLAAACRAGSPASDRVDVVASFYPVAEAAQRIGGDRAAVRNLTPTGAEPHDLELDSEHLDAILGADLVVFLGGGFQPSIEAAVAEARGEVVDLRAGRGDDPHGWLDPQGWAASTAELAKAFSRVDPAGAAQYERNARRYRAEIVALHEEYERSLDACDRDVFVTAHDAFGHLARRYRLRQVAVTGISPEAEPDPRRVAELTRIIRREGVTTVFTEPLVPPEVATAVAREAGVRVDVLNPLEGLTKEELADGESYVSVMRSNLARLRAALGCR